MCLPQPQDHVPWLPDGHSRHTPGHLGEVLSANLTGKEVSDEAGDDAECTWGGDDQRRCILG